MQRLRLYTQGVSLPKLGTIQDRVLRQFCTKQSELEAKRVEFQMLTLLTNPSIGDDEALSSWRRRVSKMWTEYVSMLFTVDLPTEDDKDEALKEFYVSKVKKSQVKLRREDSTGELIATGVEDIL